MTSHQAVVHSLVLGVKKNFKLNKLFELFSSSPSRNFSHLTQYIRSDIQRAQKAHDTN